MKTGLFDKNGTPINIGDKTRLVLDDGEVRISIRKQQMFPLREFYSAGKDTIFFHV